MRVVVYTEDYEPLGVVELHERHLQRIADRHDWVRVLVQHRINWSVHIDQNTSPLADTLDAFMSVEGMRWADGRIRQIIVARGVSRRALGRLGSEPQHLAEQLVEVALGASQRQLASGVELHQRLERDARAATGVTGYTATTITSSALADLQAHQLNLQRNAYLHAWPGPSLVIDPTDAPDNS
jgi:hypothetical protein